MGATITSARYSYENDCYYIYFKSGNVGYAMYVENEYQRKLVHRRIPGQMFAEQEKQDLQAFIDERNINPHQHAKV